MSDFGFIAVNNDHGWGKGKTPEDARKRSLVEGRKATHVRIWECAIDTAYVDGMGTVYGVMPETRRDYKRNGETGRVWKEELIKEE